MPAKRAAKKSAVQTAPHILILTMSAGGGHVSAAAALEEEFKRQPPRNKVAVADHAELIGGRHGQVLTKGYKLITAYFPRLWQAFYRLADFDFPPALCAKLRQLFSRAGERRLVDFVLNGKFDYVICTHFAAAHIIAAMKTANELALPLAVVITDFGLHRIWLAGKNVNCYFVASDDTKKQLQTVGVPPTKIVVTGIPIKKQFAIARGQVRRRHGNASGRLRLLIVETRMNCAPLARLLHALSSLRKHLLVTVVGLPQAHVNEIKTAAKNSRLTAKCHGFVSCIERYFASNDIAITKSGGLTTAETMSVGIPLLVLRPIPGQETTNLEALRRAGAGLYAKDEAAAKILLEELLAHPAKLRRLQQATKKLAKPLAAKLIVRRVLDDIAKIKKPGW